MLRPDPILGALLLQAAFVALLAPPGYALLRLAGRAPRLADLGLALAIGYSVAAPLVAVEVALGWRHLAPLAAASCLAWLRPRPSAAGLRAAASLLALPVGLGLLFVLSAAGDWRAAPEGMAFRLGFDVSDRVYYDVLVAQELAYTAPWRLTNPVFAGVPLGYSIFPELLVVLLHRATGVSLLAIAVDQKAGLAVLFTGLAVASLLEELGWRAKWDRLVVTLLLCFGGDLSFLLPRAGGVERLGHFPLFHSFGAEALHYNSWMLGLPLSLAGLALARRYLAGGRLAELALAALVMGFLWETKTFSFLALLAGALLAGALLRSRRLLALGFCAGAAALPWALVTLATGSSRDGLPLRLEPFHHVFYSAQFNPWVRGPIVGVANATGLQLIALALGAAVFLLGGFGLRLLGVPRFWRERRTDTTGLHAWLGATVALSALLSLLLVGNPVKLDGVQFLMLGQYLAWLYAGAAIAGLLRGGPQRRLAGAALLGLSVVSPLGYLLFRARPELTSPDSADRRSQPVSAETLRACSWLDAHAAPGDRLLVSLYGDPADPLGLEPLYVAALSGRRLVAMRGDYHIGLALRERQQARVVALYASGEASEAERLLRELDAQWVLETAARPLAFRSEKLVLAYRSDSLRLHRVLP